MNISTSPSPSNTAFILVILAALCLCVSSWRLDCTKFVFAPRCRGVAAKRSSSDSFSDNILSTADNDNDNSYKWRPSDLFPFNSLHAQKLYASKRPGSASRSRMESLYYHPDLEKGQLENDLYTSWKADFQNKALSQSRQKQEETELMKAYVDALLGSMQGSEIEEEDNADIKRRR